MELLVSFTLAGVVLAGVVKFFATEVRQSRAHAFRVEAQQALRGSLDAITRDLRLAGACLPGDGAFVALDGVDDPVAGDAITIRTGLVRADMSCITTSTTAALAAGATLVSVNDGTGFEPEMLAYVKHPNGSGDFSTVTAATATTVTLDTAVTQPYPAGSGIYAIDERTYALDVGADPPLLMLTINRAAPQAFAAGMPDLEVRYVLDRNCTPCDRVDLPADAAEWWLVNAVEVTATVVTVGGTQPEDQATLVATSLGKPRNLLP
jgi:hypothetical protein